MSKEKTPMQIAYGDFVGVVWDGDKPNPRTGLMGRLIDFIFGVRVTPEQIAADGREEAINALATVIGTCKINSVEMATTIYDEGYRKP